ncbi:MAG: 4a-hydroxytetrahydrobiopterin dehydratase [Woeseiaceae bacterium]
MESNYNNIDLNKALEKINTNQEKTWLIKENKLFISLRFSGFEQAIEFMNQVAKECTALNHHPDWCNSYNKLDIFITTHEAGKLTERDFVLADKINNIINR